MVQVAASEAARKGPVTYKPVPLDGGYGWLVVFGSFTIHVIADGFVYSFGVVVNSIIKEFNVSNAEASIVISILTGLMLASGPIASMSCNRLGCRLTTIIGALIASAGSFLHVIILVGVIMGIGFGFMYCAAIMIVTLYFEKLRSLATGITVCGAGVGTFVFSKIIGILVERFQWRNVLVIYSGVILLSVACGLLYRPIEYVAVPSEDISGTDEHRKSTRRRRNSSKNAEVYIAKSQQSGIFFGDHVQPPMTSELCCRQDEKVEEGQVRSPCIKDEHYNRTVSTNLSMQSTQSNSSSDSDTAHSKPLSGVVGNRAIEAKQLKGPSIWRRICDSMDLHLLTHPLFVLFMISNFFGSIGFNAPPLFMPLNAQKMFNLTESLASTTLTFYGLANTIGRVGFGFICDYQFPFRWGKDCARNRLFIYNITLMLCGLATCFVFMMHSMPLFTAYCFTYGFLISSFVCLWSVMLVDLVGVHRLVNAFGILLFVQGIATFVGPPLAGKLYDMTLKYDWTFGFCGICLFIGGIIMFGILPIQSRRRASVKSRKSSTDCLNE